MKASAECAYRDEFDLIYRNETGTAERRARDKWRQRAIKPTPPADQSSSKSAASSPSVKDLVVVKLTAIPSARPSLYRLAYLRFFFDFVTASDYNLNQTGAFQLLPDMFEKAPPDSFFHSAVSAASYANFGGRFKSDEARQVGTRYYGRALHQLAKSMTGASDGIDTNETLLGIFLLALYEVSPPQYSCVGDLVHAQVSMVGTNCVC
jgi:hypothetical protein